MSFPSLAASVPPPFRMCSSVGPVPPDSSLSPLAVAPFYVGHRIDTFPSRNSLTSHLPAPDSRHSFFVAGFGLPPDSFAKLATDCPALLTDGDVFTAGSCMLFFKGMGWRN